MIEIAASKNPVGHKYMFPCHMIADQILNPNQQASSPMKAINSTLKSTDCTCTYSPLEGYTAVA